MRAETLQCVDGPLDGQYQPDIIPLPSPWITADCMVFTNEAGDWTYKKRHREGRDVWALTNLHVRFTHSQRAW